MSFILPPIIALKSNWSNFYLNYNADSDSQTKHGLLRFNGANVFSSLAKFEVVTANTGTGLVHIRCAYNKKFIRMRMEGDVHLSPEADEPEEDQSKWSCTLFEPQAVDGNPDQVQFTHVQTKRYAIADDDGGIKFWRVYDTQGHQGIFDITDLESVVKLPNHMAVKGDNGLYLQHADNNHLRFISTNKGNAGSWFQVFTDGDGNVEIKVFNSSGNNYLWFDSTDSDKHIIVHESPSKFRPVKIDANTVALQCLSNNNKFCTRYTNLNTVVDGLSAVDTSFSINKWAHLTLEELVLSRSIYNTDFDLKNAIIYGESPVTMATANASNNTSVANTVEIKFAYKDSTSSTWTARHSWMVGLQVKAEFKIPLIGGSEVTAKGEYSGFYEWGETHTSENALEATYKVTVPAHTTLSVSLMATKVKCDVPYSCYQKDVLYNGKTVVYMKDDGLYTGANSYKFHYEVTPLKEPDINADVINRKKRSLDTSTFPLKQQKIHMPVSHGSSRVQTQVTSTATPEQEPSST